MRFVDASVFLYAYLRSEKKIPPNIEILKRNARNIVERINRGEEVTTSLVHVSEIANILESRTSLETTGDIISALLSLANLDVEEPSKALYESATEVSRSFSLGINDALAFLLMKKEDITEVYSFDKDFDKLKDLKRVTE
ncbi:MAG: type II toxin-antitoxin system VapC family toxin [Thaumarchaeota archaeon]|nr:type II toxin-antitoxin system VapC family toxin [Nitrososphaerota archaeon]